MPLRYGIVILVLADAGMSRFRQTNLK